MQAIKERQQKLGEEWMIVVTTDHGRGAKTGKDHGGQSDRERNTWIVTNAKPLNARFKQTPGAVDIAPSILKFMNLDIPAEVKPEIDGVSFVGEVSISNAKATRAGDKATVTWLTATPTGQVEILVATSNNFQKGMPDKYVAVGKVDVVAGRYTFDLPANADVYKVVLQAPFNTVNSWIVKKEMKKSSSK